MEEERGTITPINDHVWMLRDEHGDTCYLIAGREKAMLIDSMCGYVNVRDMAESVTKLPITVVNTHGHSDHVIGNVSFEEAYLHPADLYMIDELNGDAEFKEAMEKAGVRMSRFLPMHGGDVFDLGGLTVEAVEMPGHTKGSVVLLLREDRMLFTGDSVNRHLWMQLEDCLSLTDTLSALQKASDVKAQADHILHGHADKPEPIALYDQLMQGLRDIIAGKTEGDIEYKWFGGVCRQHPFAENSVIVYDEKRPVDQ